MRLVLDEHFDPVIAEQLRARGFDAIAVKEDAELRGRADRSLLVWAAEASRALVTYNVRDLIPLSKARQALGEPFAGLICLSPKRYPQDARTYGSLIRDLARLIEGQPRDPNGGRIIWLKPGG